MTSLVFHGRQQVLIICRKNIFIWFSIRHNNIIWVAIIFAEDNYNTAVIMQKVFLKNGWKPQPSNFNFQQEFLAF